MKATIIIEIDDVFEIGDFENSTIPQMADEIQGTIESLISQDFVPNSITIKIGDK